MAPYNPRRNRMLMQTVLAKDLLPGDKLASGLEVLSLFIADGLVHVVHATGILYHLLGQVVAIRA